MRFDNNKPHRNQKRTIRKFAFLPYTFDGITYWMEMVTHHQIYKIRYVPELLPVRGTTTLRQWETIGVY